MDGKIKNRILEIKAAHVKFAVIQWLFDTENIGWPNQQSEKEAMHSLFDYLKLAIDEIEN